MKFDEEKPMMALLPPRAMMQVGEVLTYGSRKYGPQDWKTTEDAEVRYMSAAMRHIFQHLAGKDFDPESGRSHIAHSICSLLFILENQIADQEKRARKLKP